MAIPGGLLIALEGIDGTGKSTQAALLRDWLAGLGVEVLSTKEPTSGPWGKKIRDSAVSSRMSPQDELHAFVSDRQEHVRDEILPALRRGAAVVIDRYYYSTVAYQGARGLSKADVLAANRAFAPIPDVVFLFDLEPEAGLERVTGRGQGKDLFETVDELSKARENFRWLARTNQHVVQLDAAQAPAEVHRALVSALVRGPLLARLPGLAAALTVPPANPAYALLALAVQLSADASLLPQERARRLWVASVAPVGR
ncbi:MAG: dTMP kinase [Myxococcaceae bacterium]|nr:dTMP kinase [Myxococcaceae bacterium]